MSSRNIHRLERVDGEISVQRNERKIRKMRKGYGDEYRTKQILVQQFGENNVIKVAIGSFGADFLVVVEGRIEKVVEVKGTRKKVWHPSQREKEQLRRILTFAQNHKCNAEVWLWVLNGGKKELHVRDVREFVVGGD